MTSKYHLQVAARSTSPDMAAVFHVKPNGSFKKI